MSSLSELLGYASIACWLGAQFPQIVQNFKLKSCEGLALPFLANWFLGDLSNLIGCLLTHQLPFQTWLATYFVLVDLGLCSQFVYYRKAKPIVHTVPVHTRTRTGSSATIRQSSEHQPSRYRRLSLIANNVATAAALVAQKDEHAESRNSHARWQRASIDRYYQNQQEASGSRVSRDPQHSSEAREGDDEVDETLLSALSDSFHSEGGSRSKRVAWSHERLDNDRRGWSVGRQPSHNTVAPLSPQILATESPTVYDSLERGRALERDALPTINPETGKDTAARRLNSRTSKRGAAMVYLSTFALFGFGALTSGKRGYPSAKSTHIGQALSPFDSNVIQPAVTTPITFSADPHPTYVEVQFHAIEELASADHPPDSPHNEPSAEMVLGRIFAWLCTTLYLTSRLPQIWKNFVRKSVEGLSMYLFVFAFLGNVFYVASILSSPQVFLPPPLSTEFLRESTPYLLGSGGTLMFDITIVAQSFIYRPHHRRQSSMRHKPFGAEEEAGLLQTEETDHHRPSEDGVHQRGRTISSNRRSSTAD